MTGLINSEQKPRTTPYYMTETEKICACALANGMVTKGYEKIINALFNTFRVFKSHDLVRRFCKIPDFSERAVLYPQWTP